MSLDKSLIKKISNTPGVYILKDDQGAIIYIGKSIKVKSRLESHILSSGTKSKKIIANTKTLEVIPVASELEALLLEAKLIKENLPKYNSSAKDDKSPLYIKITKGDFPIVGIGRGVDLRNSTFFGPFPSSNLVKLVLKQIRGTIPYHSTQITKRPCLYFHLGLCNPCPARIIYSERVTKKEELKSQYRKNIKRLILLLSGKSNELKKDLEREMRDTSKRQDFEKARQIRDQIRNLEYITLSYKNPDEYLKNPELLEDQRETETQLLYQLLRPRMKNLRIPRRIECFDNSHTAGKDPSSSMVTFTNGEPNKNLYRHFKIKKLNTRDDFAMMKEVLTRRFTHLNDWGTPDLIVIDGGKGQVSTALKVMSQVGVKYPLIGLAKRLEEIIIPKEEGDYSLVRLSDDNQALHLLQRLRDESHRFARRLHFKERLKSLKS